MRPSLSSSPSLLSSSHRLARSILFSVSSSSSSSSPSSLSSSSHCYSTAAVAASSLPDPTASLPASSSSSSSSSSSPPSSPSLSARSVPPSSPSISSLSFSVFRSHYVPPPLLSSLTPSSTLADFHSLLSTLPTSSSPLSSSDYFYLISLSKRFKSFSLSCSLSSLLLSNSVLVPSLYTDLIATINHSVPGRSLSQSLSSIRFHSSTDSLSSDPAPSALVAFHQSSSIFNRAIALGCSPSAPLFNGIIHSAVLAAQWEEVKRLMTLFLHSGGVPNVHTYGSLMRGCTEQKKDEQTVLLFKEMQEKHAIQPSPHIYYYVIIALTRLNFPERIIPLFEGEMKERKITIIPHSLAQIMNAYTHTKQAGKAIELYENRGLYMSEKDERTASNHQDTLSALFFAYSRAGKLKELNGKIEEMEKEAEKKTRRMNEEHYWTWLKAQMREWKEEEKKEEKMKAKIEELENKVKEGKVGTLQSKYLPVPHLSSAFYSSLLLASARLGYSHLPIWLWDRMRSLSFSPSIQDYNALLTIYQQDPIKTVLIKKQMEENKGKGKAVVPDASTWFLLFKSLQNHSDRAHVHRLIEEIKQKIEGNSALLLELVKFTPFFVDLSVYYVQQNQVEEAIALLTSISRNERVKTKPKQEQLEELEQQTIAKVIDYCFSHRHYPAVLLLYFSSPAFLHPSLFPTSSTLHQVLFSCFYLHKSNESWKIWLKLTNKLTSNSSALANSNPFYTNKETSNRNKKRGNREKRIGPFELMAIVSRGIKPFPKERILRILSSFPLLSSSSSSSSSSHSLYSAALQFLLHHRDHNLSSTDENEAEINQLFNEWVEKHGDSLPSFSCEEMKLNRNEMDDWVALLRYGMEYKREQHAKFVQSLVNRKNQLTIEFTNTENKDEKEEKEEKEGEKRKVKRQNLLDVVRSKFNAEWLQWDEKKSTITIPIEQVNAYHLPTFADRYKALLAEEMKANASTSTSPASASASVSASVSSPTAAKKEKEKEKREVHAPVVNPDPPVLASALRSSSSPSSSSAVVSTRVRPPPSLNEYSKHLMDDLVTEKPPSTSSEEKKN